MNKLSLLITGLLFIFSLVYSQEIKSADRYSEAVNFVNKGLDYIKTRGNDEAFTEFSNPRGKFSSKRLYLFVVDFKGMVLAHGANTNFIGKNQLDLMDADGKYFIREFINIASNKGAGWVSYKWSNPATKKIQNKTTYIKKIDSMDAFLGCGVYK